MGQQGVGTGIADISLDDEFVARATGAAVDLGDENDGEGSKVASRPYQLEADVRGVTWRAHGRGGVEDVDVVVGDEEVWVCGGDDDDFDAGVVVVSEAVDEGGEVGGELVVPEVDGRVVDGCAYDAAIGGGGQGSVAWG